MVMKLLALSWIFILALSCAETTPSGSLARVDIHSEGETSATLVRPESSLVRVERSMKDDIEKGFKEFSDKVSKLPDQLTGTLKKYFEEKGISMESIQKILNDIWEAVEKLIEEVKKAM